MNLALSTRSTGKAIINGKSTMLFNYKGIDLSAKQLARVLNVTVGTIYNRLHNGYSPDAVCQKGRLAKVHTIDGRRVTAKNISGMFGVSTSKVYNILNKCAITHTKIALEMFVK